MMSAATVKGLPHNDECCNDVELVGLLSKYALCHNRVHRQRPRTHLHLKGLGFTVSVHEPTCTVSAATVKVLASTNPPAQF